jgi:hypothetical protein
MGVARLLDVLDREDGVRLGERGHQAAELENWCVPPRSFGWAA